MREIPSGSDREVSQERPAIAVVGMSCRLPMAPDIETFWRLLREGESAISEVPPGRWRETGLSEPALHAAGRSNSLRGGFLDDVEQFDPGFFGISPRAATAMDPQQRLMLELTWEALEDAGIVPATLSGSRTGVFVGSMADDYAKLLSRIGPSAITQHTVTGLNRGATANRISYALGLHGPSLATDSAQSSSLVAVHLACQSLLRGESTVALAGGVNLNLIAESAAAASAFGALSPDGACYTFDARANGYARGEGAGVVVLKPLSAANDDGDTVYCVIRGSAVNNNGASANLTAPSQAAQQAVVELACREARVEPSDVEYVELHGTGTRLGDPIEAAALGAVFGAARPAGSPLIVGSAKTNVGHLEGAAGMVGLLKAALSVHHGVIPASLNFERPSPLIPLADLNLAVPQETQDWPNSGNPRLAGVSSFGMGGTNCHLLIAQHPMNTSPPAHRSGAGPAPYVLSGRTSAALRGQAARLRAHLAAHPDQALPDVAYSLATTRSPFEHRAAVVAADRDGLSRGLEALAQEIPAPSVVRGLARERGRVAFLFSGQGSQRVGMGRELYEKLPAFRDPLLSVLAELDRRMERPVSAVLLAAEGSPEAALLDETVYTQAALFAVEIALYRLVEQWGVVPDLLLGHSIGEIAAAHVAGVLSLPDACALVAARGRLMQELPPGGAMLAIEAVESEVADSLVGMEGRVAVAAVNGPRSVVVSGDEDAVDEVNLTWAGQGRKTKRLQVSHAFHSPRMDGMLQEFMAVAETLTFRAPSLPFVSDVTGKLITDGQACSAAYWAEHVRHPVRFADGMRCLEEQRVGACLELGPDGVLVSMGQDCFDPGVSGASGAMVLVPALRTGQPEEQSLLTAVAALHVAGVPVDWEAVFAPGEPRRVPLPTYAFQRAPYWPAGRPLDLPDTLRTDADSTATVTIATATTGTATGESEDPLSGEEESPAERLARLPKDEAAGLSRELVLRHAAAVLGHVDIGDLDTGRPFKDLGFDSLMSVELRTALSRTLDKPLPATVLFDYPTPRELAEYVCNRILGLEDSGPDIVRPLAGAEEPIAIVGMACRFPGGVGSPEELWRLVAGAGDAVSEFPVDRGWDLAGLLDADPDRVGASSTRRGGFLHGAAEFDAGLFGISPREAVAMDPQQRLLLETSWEVLERAGIDPTSLKGSNTGVFTGVMAQDYGPRLHDPSEDTGGYLLTGSSPSVASGRVAYGFGFEGPALTVDTACSSSLVALHLAVRALRSGECSLALAGGATVMATPGMFVEFSRQGGLSVDGRCKAFADAADGTGWGEGVGVLLVERLSDARRNGRRVLAVVRGSAVNQDGASNGLTAPNGPAQQRVIRRALGSAGLSAVDVDVVEAHGTGTRLGDPIEAQALLATYGQGRSEGRPLWLGSVKSNVGHTQAAAGVAGVIKMVMAMRHGVLPRTLHVNTPSRHVDWSSGSVELLTRERAWPRGDRLRRAGVSAFGISGTNAHVILEEAPMADIGEPEAPAAPDTDRPPHALPWILSAPTAESLQAQARQLLAYVSAHPEIPVAGVGRALGASRSGLKHRAVAVADDRSRLLEAVRALGEEGPGADLVHGVAGPARKVAFVFPGQGAQWAGMGKALLDTSRAFTDRVAECEEALSQFVDWSLTDVLRGAEDAPGLDRVDVVQPVSFAVMVSLAAVWESYGVSPSAVVGHSQGEIAAACVAGGLTLVDAARVVALRSQALSALSGEGGMVSVPLPARQVRDGIAPYAEHVSVAAINGPSSTVVSGDPRVLAELVSQYEQEGVRARRISVDYASHSPQVRRTEQRLAEALAPIEPRSGTVPFYSSVSGGITDTADLDADYWYRNLRQTVEFEQATCALLEHGCDVFVEVSAHPVLAVGIQETADDRERSARVVGTLRRDSGDLTRFITSLAEAYTCGVTVDWARVFDGCGDEIVDIPTYAFQRRRYWWENGPRPTTATDLGLLDPDHPLLGAVVESADDTSTAFTGRLSLATHPWLADHAVHDTVILPGSAFVELVVVAGDRLGCEAIEELVIQAPLVLPEEGAVHLRVLVEPAHDSGRRAVTVYSRAEGRDSAWDRNAAGILTTVPGDDQPSAPREDSWPPAGASAVSLDGLYTELAEKGYQYGPAFQGLRAAWQRDGDTFADVALPEREETRATRFVLHPALLDAALHAVGLGALAGMWDGRLPFSWSGVRLHASAASAARVRIRPTGQDTVSLLLTDAAGSPVASIDSLVVRAHSPEELRERAAVRQRSLFAVGWHEQSVPGGPVPGPDRIAVLGRATPLPTGHEDGAAHYEDVRALIKAVDAGASVPDVVFLGCPLPDADLSLARDARTGTARVLGAVQAWAADERLSSSRLVVVTRGAVSCRPGEEHVNLRHAPVWGLVRTAQAENPGGGLFLLDLDDHADWAMVVRSVRETDEPQLSVRSAALLVPRLVRAASLTGAAPRPDSDVQPMDPHGTVLVTGATGTLGGLVSRHLVARWGMKHLLLTSRRGPNAPGASSLVRELTEMGATVELVPCDAADRQDLARVLDEIPGAHPLTGVIHAAGVLDDGVLESLDAERLDRVMRPKVDAAVNLDELTSGTPVSAFVLFSSATATFGTQGQANYTAANAFLDALATQRRARGLPGVSLAWGPWAERTAMTGHLTDEDLKRLARAGFAQLPTDEALELFDSALRMDLPLQIAARLDTAALRTRSTAVPHLFRSLLKVDARSRPTASAPGTPDAPPSSLAERLAGLGAAERDRALLDLVRTHASAVLGHAGSDSVPVGEAFRAMGFDSLAAVELRNRLRSATGARLTTTAIFDYPTPLELARHLRSMVLPDEESIGSRFLAHVEELESVLTEFEENSEVPHEALARLQALLRRLNDKSAEQEEPDTIPETALNSATNEEIFELLDRELGKP
ncbi:type I polyketide synthase [Streptomyces tsukubensis]|nr:type I polyketide synthase [Streptomyces tsukubensis]